MFKTNTKERKERTKEGKKKGKKRHTEVGKRERV